MRQESNVTTLWLVRHGKTMFNTVGRVQGWADSPLTEEGKSVVRQLAKGLQSQRFDAMYSSDSGRARETLRLIAEQNHHPLPLQEDERLREICFGSFEGELESVMWAEVAASLGKSTQEWWDGFTPIGYANDIVTYEHQRQAQRATYAAESYETVRDRLIEALHAIVQKHPLGAQILVVMHGGSIATLLSYLDSEKHKSAGSIKNASVSQLCYHPATNFTISTLNDTSFIT